MEGTEVISDIVKIEESGEIILSNDILKDIEIDDDCIFKVLIANNNILLRKIDPHCVFCGEKENTVHYKNKVICKKCLSNMKVAK